MAAAYAGNFLQFWMQVLYLLFGTPSSFTAWVIEYLTSNVSFLLLFIQFMPAWYFIYDDVSAIHVTMTVLNIL